MIEFITNAINGVLCSKDNMNQLKADINDHSE